MFSAIEEKKRRTFPSQPETNPNDAKLTYTAQVNAIHTLRFRRQIDN